MLIQNIILVLQVKKAHKVLAYRSVQVKLIMVY